ncbi:hypothetical protein [Singulisphaera sp. PoT]|uniref:hypothetical protein n=1 Tax=Singulisphaera sp. PoT TaxID=3411797 RepID=UPI003BF5B454
MPDEPSLPRGLVRRPSCSFRSPDTHAWRRRQSQGLYRPARRTPAKTAVVPTIVVPLRAGQLTEVKRIEADAGANRPRRIGHLHGGAAELDR